MSERSGIIQRDVQKLLPFIENTLECKEASTRILALAAVIASVAYLDGLSKEKTMRLVALMVENFDPEEQ